MDSAQGNDIAPFFLKIGAKVKNFLRLSHLYDANLSNQSQGQNLVRNSTHNIFMVSNIATHTCK